MSFNLSLYNSISNAIAGQSSVRKPEERVYARVVDVCLDSSHPDYESRGRLEAINGIRYKVLGSSKEEDREVLPFAYSSQSDFKRVPVVNEIVEVVTGLSNSLGESNYKNKQYYTFIQNLWNNTHHNASPDLVISGQDIDLGPNVEEKTNIASIQPFPGDTYIQGRLGQSIRLSGYTHPLSKLSNETNNGDPYTIIRIGQPKETDSFVPYIEDINKDAASIYATSNHTVPLTPSVDKFNTYRDTTPETPVNYKGSQVVIDSGRLYFHAKNDHILLNSKNSIGLISTSTNLDATNYISLDSPKIYLGANAKEPVLRGDKTVELLNSILQTLTAMAESHQLAITPTLASTQLVAASSEMLPKLQRISNQLQGLKSTKSFTE